jgi:putative DNA primase/helicase
LIHLELKIRDEQGRAVGVARALNEAGETVHSDRSDDWWGAVPRQRFCKAVAAKAYADPTADGAAEADHAAKLAEIAARRDAARREVEDLFVARLDELKREADRIAQAALNCGGVEDAPGETRRSFVPHPDHVVEYQEPLRLAEHYLRHNARDDLGRLTLRRYRSEWWTWSRGVGYSRTPDETLDAGVYRHLDKLWTPARDKDGNAVEGEFTKVVPKSSTVREVHLALPSRGLIVDGDMPQWLDGRPDPKPSDVIAFRNGLMDAEAWCHDEDAKPVPTTPLWFSATSCPFDHDPSATCPAWLAFLGQAFDGDRERHDLLQEWFGYQLVPDNRFEAFMVLLGKPRAGKGTTIDALTAMLGAGQVASTSFAKLAGRFGLHPLLGRLAAVMPDAHLNKSTDGKAALEVLKSITGGDAQGVDRKGVDELPQVRLTCRFTIAVNEMPKLPDDAGALKPRMKLLNYDNSMVGREDRTLKGRIKAEAQGVAAWAMRGLYRLRANGGFTEPATSARILAEAEKLMSPVKCFGADHLEVGEGHYAPKDDVYRAWKRWCEERGDEPGNVAQFGEQLLNAFTGVTSGRRGPRGQQFTTYEGVRLCT